MTDDGHVPSVRPLDEAGNPVDPSPIAEPRRRSATLIAIAVGGLAVLAFAAVLVWRAMLGSPFTAAEAVPSDADMVMSIDFLQIRDLDRVDRLIRAFAEPMADHGIIDEVPDLDAALREFDDAVEEETGFRFAEDVFSWIGRSGSIAFWFPEDIWSPSLEAVPQDVVPEILITLEVRDEEAARSFVDRMVEEAADSGTDVDMITVAGIDAYAVDSRPETIIVGLDDGRLLIAQDVDTVRRAIELDAADSVAQTDDFQELASAVGGDPIVSFYVAPSMMESLGDLYEQAGVGSMGIQVPDTGIMSAVTLDDDGLLARSAVGVTGDGRYEPGTWAADLPAGTYGFVDVVIPERFLEGLIELYDESLTQAGVTDQDVEELTGPIDEMLGMSLTDDLLPQFGGELLFAVMPATDGLFAADMGVDLGMLLGIGVADADVVRDALDNVIEVATREGVTVDTIDGVGVIDLGGGPVAGFSVTEEALIVSTSPDSIEELAGASGALGAGETFGRTDDLIRGDGLVFYVDIAGIVDGFVTEDEVGDVLAPLISIGAGFEMQGDLLVSDFRLVLDF